MNKEHTETFAAMMGTNNPENGDYLAGMQSDVPLFKSVRTLVDPSKVAAMTDAEIEREIGMICRDNVPTSGPRLLLLKLYQQELNTRANDGAQVHHDLVGHRV